MAYENILTEVQEGILYITLNRESKLNALNIQTLQEVKAAVAAAQDNPEVKVIILTGSGSKAFAAGADIAEFAGFNVTEGTQMAADGHEVMNTLERSRKPVIAAINGFALGGGCELAMSCHVRVAAENAKFGQPEVNLGLIPGYAGTQRLIQLLGKGKATELLLTGDVLNAQDALHAGLVTHVVPQAELLDKCREIARKMMDKSPLALAAVIRCVNEHFGDAGFRKEIEEFGLSFGTNDFKEGTTAFLGKRKAEFKGN